MRRWRGFVVPLLGLVLIVLATGCAKSNVSLQTGPRSFTQESYAKVYRAWSRSAEDFSWGNLRDVLRVTATFESWEFRWAYAVRYAHDHSLTENERTGLLQTSLAAAKTEHRFLVTLSGNDHRESNLAGKKSAWRVLLIDSKGHQAFPKALERVRHPTAANRVYFPSISPHRETFRITFDVKTPEGKPTIPVGSKYVDLRFAGPHGIVDLRWEFASRRED